MERTGSAALVGRIAALKKEALALSREGGSFPAMWRNSLRILACVRMMEMDLGLEQDWGEPASDAD